MKTLVKNITCILVTVFTVTVFLSCDNNKNEIDKLTSVSFLPQTEAEHINLKYTDSGKVTAILLSDIMQDYSNAKYAFVASCDIVENHLQRVVSPGHRIILLA